jgi:hypothetical protein
VDGVVNEAHEAVGSMKKQKKHATPGDEDEDEEEDEEEEEEDEEDL